MEDHTKEREEALAKAESYVEGSYAPGGFSVVRRDTYHFDVYAARRPGYVNWYLLVENPMGMAWPLRDGMNERAFAIRGEPGNIYIRDERWDYMRPRPREPLTFLSVEAAMSWVSATLLIDWRV
jgi:hypothetical protein